LTLKLIESAGKIFPKPSFRQAIEKKALNLPKKRWSF